jgi:hypothetical protein
MKIAAGEKLALQELSDDWVGYHLCPERDG